MAYDDLVAQVRRLQADLRHLPGGEGLVYDDKLVQTLRQGYCPEDFGLSQDQVVFITPGEDLPAEKDFDPQKLYIKPVSAGVSTVFFWFVSDIPKEREPGSQQAYEIMKLPSSREILTADLKDLLAYLAAPDNHQQIFSGTHIRSKTPYPAMLHQASFNMAHMFEDILTNSKTLETGFFHWKVRKKAFDPILNFIRWKNRGPIIADQRSFQIGVALHRFLSSQRSPTSDGRRLLDAYGQDELGVKLFVTLPGALKEALDAYRRHTEEALPPDATQEDTEQEADPIDQLQQLAAEYALSPLEKAKQDAEQNRWEIMKLADKASTAITQSAAVQAAWHATGNTALKFASWLVPLNDAYQDSDSDGEDPADLQWVQDQFDVDVQLENQRKARLLAEAKTKALAIINGIEQIENPNADIDDALRIAIDTLGDNIFYATIEFTCLALLATSALFIQLLPLTLAPLILIGVVLACCVGSHIIYNHQKHAKEQEHDADCDARTREFQDMKEAAVTQVEQATALNASPDGKPVADDQYPMLTHVLSFFSPAPGEDPTLEAADHRIT